MSDKPNEEPLTEAQYNATLSDKEFFLRMITKSNEEKESLRDKLRESEAGASVMRKWVDEQVEYAEGQVASETLGGNIVKLNFAKGELASARALLGLFNSSTAGTEILKELEELRKMHSDRCITWSCGHETGLGSCPVCFAELKRKLEELKSVNADLSRLNYDCSRLASVEATKCHDLTRKLEVAKEAVLQQEHMLDHCWIASLNEEQPSLKESMLKEQAKLKQALAEINKQGEI